MCGASVADAQTTLQQGSGRLAVFQHDAHCVLVKLVVIVFGTAVTTWPGSAFAILARSLQEVFLVLSFALRTPELDDRGNFLLRHQGSVQAMHPGRSVR